MTILLSFDIEEFDVPNENGVDIPLETQMAISVAGAKRLLSVLEKHSVRGTFFCTANFAEHAPLIMQRIIDGGHEVASHGYYHSSFDIADLRSSRTRLQELTGQEIAGYRMARLKPLANDGIIAAGYKYNSSLNPTFIPGRYNNLRQPRTIFTEGPLIQCPTSVTPLFRIPLFWLSMHNFPFFIYRTLAMRTLRHDGYLLPYFHPWEFVDLKQYPDYKISFLMRNNSGEKLVRRLDSFIGYALDKGCQFATISDYLACCGRR